jgi:penicillin-binding protein 1C
LPVTAQQVDRNYIAMLLAYEDKRFRTHGGVDLRAMARAAWSSLKAGRIVSGGSTLTMQVARLLEDAPTRSFRAKLRQVRVALALERRLDKDAILDLYLTLAPFGGNIEGVRAASLVWFGHEPRRLTPAQAALLVALPQSPEGRRPDRHRKAARAARDRVLTRVVGAGALAAEDARAARTEPVPNARRAFPRLAPHLADRLVRKARPSPQPSPLGRGSRPHSTAASPLPSGEGQGEGAVVHTTLDATLQADLETLLRQRATSLGPAISAAAIVADHATGEILASVGSADLMDPRRRG